MAVRKGYNRFFIIFQEEDKGYGIAIDKQPTGYAKIEVRSSKCKITVYAQNLKKEKGPYHFCMMDTMKSPAQLIKFGEIRIDEIGRGETWWEYNEDNIAESGSPIDKFNVAAIFAGGEHFLAPLAGYTCKEKIEWKDKIMIKTDEKHEHDHKHEHSHDHNEHHRNIGDENNEADIDLDDEGMKFKDYEESLRSASVELEESDERGMKGKSMPKANIQPIAPEIIENVPIMPGQPEEYEPMVEEIEVPAQYEDEAELEEGEYEDGYNQGNINREGKKHHQHKEYKAHSSIFHHILGQFEEMEELLEDFDHKDCRWWKIPYDKSVPMMDERHYPFLCTIFHLNMTYPHIDYIKYYCDRGHYYFGIKYDKDNDVKYIMYGIEGMNTIKDQPYMGMTGFGKWMKLRDKNTGMWILFYNPRTGNFMVERPE